MSNKRRASTSAESVTASPTKQKSVSDFFASNKKPKTDEAKSPTTVSSAPPAAAAAASSAKEEKKKAAPTSTSSSVSASVAGLGLEVRSVVDQATFIAAIEQLSRKLMGHVELMINEQRHRLIEIEYYYNAPDANHVDSFAHGNKLQKDTCGHWYFHRQGGGTYKSGTYKGLDITFGVAGGPHGGILIRTIQKCDDKKAAGKNKSSVAGGELIEGPCKVVNHILETCGYDVDGGVAPLADHIPLDVFAPASPIHFVMAANPADAPIVASARVGLTLKVGTLDRERYILAPYRHIARSAAYALKKFPVTIVLGLLVAGEKPANITAWTKVTSAKLSAWTKLYNEAKNKAIKAAAGGGAAAAAAAADDDEKKEDGDEEENDGSDDDESGKKKKKSKPKKKASTKSSSAKAKGPLSAWYGMQFNTDTLATLYGAWSHHYATPLTRAA